MLTSLAAATALTACTPSLPPAEPIEPPTPEPIVKTEVADMVRVVADNTVHAEAGDIVTEEEAFWLAEGLTAYPLESGELIVVDENEPLPDALRNEIVAMIHPNNPAEIYQRMMRKGEGRSTDAWRKANDISYATGRSVVFVMQGISFSRYGGVEYRFWALQSSGKVWAGSAEDSRYTYSTRAQAIAGAEAFAAEHEGYEVIIVD